MKYRKLGHTGLDVSAIALGCMGFGDPERWHGRHPWTIGEAEARPIIKQALDMGINFFDTANLYSLGHSEEILGNVLHDYISRDELVIETKVNQRMRPGPNGAGSSRKVIMHEIDQSLKRLKTDYVDVYLLHRWDSNTPIEETVDAMQDVVRAGKARYIGCSTMAAWQFQKARNIADKKGGANFVVMQDHYNLLFREEEREMIPYCQDARVGLCCYSPLAAGRLAMRPDQADNRRNLDRLAKQKYDASTDLDRPVIDRVVELADRYEVPVASVAQAWLRAKDYIPVCGATESTHFEAMEKSFTFDLTAEEIAYLEEPYKPHLIAAIVNN